MKREDLFVDFVERADDDLEEESNKQDIQNATPSASLQKPPKPPTTMDPNFSSKQKKQLREGVKHMTKYTLNENFDNNFGGSDKKQRQSKLMHKLMKEDQDDKVRKLEKYRQMEEDKQNREELVKAEKMIIDEKKWNKEVIQKIDIVPDDPNYYDKLAVKPGFDFLYAIINSSKDDLEILKIQVPETLYFNYNSYLLWSDLNGRIHVKQGPTSRDFLTILESKSNEQDIIQNWQDPATVLRKATSHPCYTTVNLHNWKQTYEHIRSGPANRTMIQRYQKSFGDKLTLYRAVVHPEEMVNAKGTGGKYNYCYALTNKISFKASIDDNQRILDEFQQMQQEGADTEIGQVRQKLNTRFENRYLICPFEVGSFDIYTYTGKTMAMIEKEAYKVFYFMQKAFDMSLLNCVTDWIRDEKGNYWFIGLKSFKLREESYIHKTTKPSAFDRELLAINVNKRVKKIMCARCRLMYKPSEVENNKINQKLFKEVKKVPGIKDQDWIQKKYIENYLKDNQSDDYYFCDVCYSLILRETELLDIQQQLAYLEYIPQEAPAKNKKQKELPKNIRNNQRFRPKFYQWRLLTLAHKLIVIIKLLIFKLGCKSKITREFGEYVTRFQLSHPGQPMKYVFEKIKTQQKLTRTQNQVVTETEALVDENNQEVEVLQSNREMVRISKINKARVNYFYTNQKRDLSNFFNSCELEFRLTLGQNWNNYVSVCKGYYLNYFSTVEFKRGTESHYTRNMLLFTEDLQGINLRLTLGISLDNECDLSHLPATDLKDYLGQQVFLPSESYFPTQLQSNAIPPQWLKLIRSENAVGPKQDSKDIGKKLYHPDGKPYTKMDYYRLEKYGSVSNKLLNTTVANRAAGMDENAISPDKNGSDHQRNRSATQTASKAGLTIPEQLQLIKEKKKLKRRAVVMPSQKAAFFKKNKLPQNVQPKGAKSTTDLDKLKGSDDEKEEDEENKANLKHKVKLKDMFKDEGMFSSINENVMRKSFTLLKSANKDQEKQYLEEEMKLLDYDEQYNETLFDPQVIKKIEINNLKKTNPYDKQVLKHEKEEKKEQDRKLLLLEQFKANNTLLPPAGAKRGRTQIAQKVITRIDRKKSKLQKEKEEKEKEEQEAKELKNREDRKYRELKAQMSNKILKNIRSVNYANFSTL